MPVASVYNVVVASGIYGASNSENIGTGNGSKVKFAFENKKIVSGSVRVFVDDVEKRNFQLNTMMGKIIFTSAPENGKEIVVFYKFFKTEEHSEEDIENLILEAEAQVAAETGFIFSDDFIIEYFQGREIESRRSLGMGFGNFYGRGYGGFGRRTDEIASDEDRREIILENVPVTSIDSVEFLKSDGTVEGNPLVRGKDYELWENSGKINFLASPIPFGFGRKKIKVVYHSFQENPMARRAVAITAAMKWLVAMTGGSFTDIATYTIGNFSASVGVPYMNLKTSLEAMTREIMRIYKVFGARKISWVI